MKKEKNFERISNSSSIRSVSRCGKCHSKTPEGNLFLLPPGKKNISYANGARVTGTQSPVGSRNTEAAWRHRFSLSLFYFNEKEKKNLKDNNILIIILRVCTYMRTWAAKKGERVNRALSFTVYTSADSSLNDQIRQRSSSVGNLGCDRWIKRRRRRKQNVFKMKRENATTSFHLVPFLLSFRNIKNDDAMVIRLLPSSPSCNTFRRRLLFIPAHSCPIPLRCRKKKKKNESASMLITSQWWEWLPSRPTAERKRIIYDLVSIIFF